VLRLPPAVLADASQQGFRRRAVAEEIVKVLTVIDRCIAATTNDCHLGRDQFPEPGLEWTVVIVQQGTIELIGRNDGGRR